MARFDFGPAIDLLSDAREVVVCGHVNPDGDSLGCVLALSAALRERGHHVTPLLASKERPRLYDFLVGYDALVPACEYTPVPDVFISVDVPTIGRTGDAVAVFKRARKSIAIDHHQGDANFASVSYVDETAAAAGLIVWDFINQLGVEITPEIATCCYTALVTDTGRFQFQNADARALEAASQMASAGAVPSEISRNVYQRRSIAALKLRSLVIDRMTMHCDGRIVVSWVSKKDFDRLDATKDDGESLIDVIRQLEGIEVAVMLREDNAVIRGSIRAKADWDVSEIARQFGGGGHRAAAGFTARGKLDKVISKIVKMLDESFARESTAEQGSEENGSGDSAVDEIDEVVR